MKYKEVTHTNMKKIIKHISYLSLLIAFVGMGACNDDFQQNSELPLPDGANGIEFSMSVRNAQDKEHQPFRSATTGAVLRAVSTEPGDYDAASYGTDPLNENVINSITAFLFDETGALIRSFDDAKVQRLTPDADPTIAGAYKVRLIIPSAEKTLLTGKTVQIVAVANAKADIITGVTTLSELEAKLQVDNLDQTTALESFLMDGTVTATVAWNAENIFTVPTNLELRRALAKIRLRIADVNVTDHQNGVPTPYEIVDNQIAVKLFHYGNTTTVIKSTSPYMQATWLNTEYRPMEWKTLTGKTGNFLMAFPFYAYENNWSANPKNESYLMVKIKLRPTLDANGQPNTADPGKDYFYKFPVNYRMPMGGVSQEKLNRLERNHLYDIVTTINEMGSLDEGTPVEVESNIAIQPWPTPDKVDGTISQAHYLVVKETEAIMANAATREIDYISDLPVTIKIDSAYYEYYDMRGDYYKVVYTAAGQRITYNKAGTAVETVAATPFDGAKATPSVEYLQDGKITITHLIPENYVPFHIKFTVTQNDPGNAKPLSQQVHVTQYPPLYVTGQKSKGFRPTEGDILAGRLYADFRFHTTFGFELEYQGVGKKEPQKNDVFNRITTTVATGSYRIGDPVDYATNKTKTDATSNNLVSPEFIIATQYGMVVDIPQSTGGSTYYSYFAFPSGYGPYARPLYKSSTPYRENDPGTNYNNTYKSYTNAEDRCYNYFEGEYGTNGTYTEYYRASDASATWTPRTVTKTFKYQGRWRIPTVAEAKLIDKIQDDPNSVTKSLMFGTAYWTAQSNTIYDFVNNTPKSVASTSTASVRCIFDTGKFNDK